MCGCGSVAVAVAVVAVVVVVAVVAVVAVMLWPWRMPRCNVVASCELQGQSCKGRVATDDG